MDASKSTSRPSKLDGLATSVELARKNYSEVGSRVEQEEESGAGDPLNYDGHRLTYSGLGLPFQGCQTCFKETSQ